MKSISTDMKQRLKISLLLSLLYALPQIIYGRYYIDDLGRSLYGYEAWGGKGRPLTDFVMRLLYLGKPLADISPLPQLLAVSILAVTIALLSKKFTDEGPLIGVIACFPLLSSPFLLQNLSYKYDSFPMALSIFVATVPFLINYNKIYAYFLTSFFSLLAVLCLYQASVNVFMIFMCLNFIYLLINDGAKNSLIFLLTSSVSIIITYLVYSKLIIPFYLHDPYGVSHSKLVTPFSNEFISVIKQNYTQFYRIIRSAFQGQILYALFPIFIFFIIGIIGLSIKQIKQKKPINILGAIALILSPIVVAFSILGPMLFLKSPIFMPRTLVAAGAGLTFLFIVAIWGVPRRTNWLKYLWIIPIFYMFSISYVYVNAARQQQKLDDVVINQIATDINVFNLKNEKYIAIRGVAPNAIGSLIAEQKYPIIRDINLSYMNNYWFWGYTELRHYGINLSIANYLYYQNINKRICSSDKISNGNFFNLYKDGPVIIIDFTKKTCGT